MPNPNSTLGMLVMVVFYLALIIGLFAVIIKLLAKRQRTGFAGRVVKPMGGAPLGQNKSVQVVEIGNSLFVLGVGEDIRLIAKIDDPEEAAVIRAAAYGGRDTDGAGFPSIKDWVAFLAGKKRTGTELPAAEADFKQVFRDKMLTMTKRKKKVDEWIFEESYERRRTEDE